MMEKSVNLILIVILVTSMYHDSFSSAPAHKCTFAAYENSELRKAAIEKLAPILGHTYISHDSEEGASYEYTVGICTNVIKGDSKFLESAVVQRKKVNGVVDQDFTRNVGSLTNVHIMSGTDWVYIEYTHGEKYKTHCNAEDKRSIVVLTCDPDVDDSNARMMFIQEETQKDEDCFYLFEMKHKAVCPSGVSSGGLSVGSILLIVFFTVAGIYLLVGFLYSRFILGNKGMDQIPNYEFWQDFGNLTADGCDFVCRSGSGRVRSGDLRGLGDDQLDSEIVRDENLLPM